MQVHTFILPLDTRSGCLTAPATSPQVAHELKAGRTSETQSMWTPQKFVPLNRSFLVRQPAAQMLQGLAYPSSLQACCYPVYSTALHE